MMANPFFDASEWEALRRRVSEPRSAPEKPDTSRPVYLFGCGRFCQSMRPSIDNVKGLDVRGCLDNNPDKQGQIIQGWRVYSPGEAAERIIREKALVVISMYDEPNIAGAERMCREMGLPYTIWPDFWPAPEVTDKGLALAENPEIIRCLDIWGDEESRQTYRKVIRYRITGDAADRPRVSEPHYFISEIPPVMLRDFVDCGAFIGDTLLIYKELCNNDFHAYHAFEPFACNLPALEKAAGRDPRVHVYPFAVSDFNGTTGMRESDNTGAMGSMAILDAAAESRIEVRRMDDVLGDRRIGCIKMDIEGSEPAALRGGEGIIRRERPVLAISIYHDDAHLWSIPSWIGDLNLGYRLLLRHHSRFPAETVCYALPS